MRWHSVVILFGVALLGPTALTWAHGGASATTVDQGVLRLAVDADPTNGTRPCSPIDGTRIGAPTSGTYTVAVCLEGNAAAAAAFDVIVVWSGGAAMAPEVADAVPALADNPDANEGGASTQLGTGWDCSGLGVAFPQGDDPNTPSRTDARIVCNANLIFPVTTLTAEPGLLATLTMQASGSGTMTFTFDPLTSFFVTTGLYECSLVTCHGATVVQGAPVSVGGIAEQPDVTALPARSSGAAAHGLPYEFTALAVIAGAGLIVGTWCVRRRRT